MIKYNYNSIQLRAIDLAARAADLWLLHKENLADMQDIQGRAKVMLLQMDKLAFELHRPEYEKFRANIDWDNTYTHIKKLIHNLDLGL